MRRYLAFAGVALAACGDSTSDTGWSIHVSTRADGATVVVNTPPADATPTWQLEEELRIGTVDRRTGRFRADQGDSGYDVT